VELDRVDGVTCATATLGEDIIVHLAENPTTGYRWTVDGALPDQQVIESTGDSFAPGDGGVGAGGVRTFQFKASAVGQASLMFTLARSWQPTSPLDEYGVVITVIAPDEAAAASDDTDGSGAGIPPSNGPGASDQGQ